MSWKFSDQPTVWVALFVSAADVATELGVPVTSALRAAIIALITAIGAIVTWKNVSPSAKSVRVDQGKAVAVNVTAPGGLIIPPAAGVTISNVDATTPPTPPTVV